ncbi:MAG: hypothetical protein EBW64_06595 [Betaproteobacteria bacterium]|nr:hypothetical protein [Betaproteobacteria bacterium]
MISLFIAGGGGIGNAVIQSIYKKEGKIPEPHLAKSFRVLAFISLIAVIVMWVTGIILVILIYSGFNLGWSFHVKLFGATLILLTSLLINVHLKKCSQNQMPPNQILMKYSASLARLGLILAIAGAIWTFV